MDSTATFTAEKTQAQLVTTLRRVMRLLEIRREQAHAVLMRKNGSFGVLVMSDPPALEYQKLDEEAREIEAFIQMLLTKAEKES